MEFENLHLMPAPPPPRNPKPAEFIPTKRELQALDALHSKHAPGVAAIARLAPPCECFPWGWKSIPNRWLISGHRTASDFVVNLTWNSTSSILLWVSHSTRIFFYCDVYPGIWSVSPLPLQPCPLRSPSSSPSTERPAMPSLMQIDPTSSHPWSLFLSGKQWTWHLFILGSLTVICIFFSKSVNTETTTEFVLPAKMTLTHTRFTNAELVEATCNKHKSSAELESKL